MPRRHFILPSLLGAAMVATVVAQWLLHDTAMADIALMAMLCNGGMVVGVTILLLRHTRHKNATASAKHQNTAVITQYGKELIAVSGTMATNL